MLTNKTSIESSSKILYMTLTQLCDKSMLHQMKHCVLLHVMIIKMYYTLRPVQCFQTAFDITYDHKGLQPAFIGLSDYIWIKSGLKRVNPIVPTCPLSQILFIYFVLVFYV